MKHIRLILGISLITVGAYFLVKTISGNGETPTQQIIGNAVLIIVLATLIYVLFKPVSMHQKSAKLNPSSSAATIILRTLGVIIGVTLILAGTYTLINMVQEEHGAVLSGVITGYILLCLACAALIYFSVRTKPHKKPSSNIQPEQEHHQEPTAVAANQQTPSTTIASDQPLAVVEQPSSTTMKNQAGSPSPQSVMMAREIIYATRVLVASFILGVVTFFALWLGVYNGLKYTKPDYSDVYMRYDSTVDNQALLDVFFPLTKMGLSEALGLQGIMFERKYNPEFDSLYRERLRIGKTSDPQLEKAWRKIITKRRYSITNPTREAMALYAHEFPYLTNDIVLRPVLGKWRSEYLDSHYLDESKTTEELVRQVDYIIKEKSQADVKKSLYIAVAVFLTTIVLWLGGRYAAKATHWVKETAKYDIKQQQ